LAHGSFVIGWPLLTIFVYGIFHLLISKGVIKEKICFRASVAILLGALITMLIGFAFEEMQIQLSDRSDDAAWLIASLCIYWVIGKLNFASKP
jgi:hypothetical protein